MMWEAIRALAGQTTDAAAWQALFRQFNPEHAISAWISARAKRRLRAMEAAGHRDVRWALQGGVKSWLRRQGLIEDSIKRNRAAPCGLRT